MGDWSASKTGSTSPPWNLSEIRSCVSDRFGMGGEGLMGRVGAYRWPVAELARAATYNTRADATPKRNRTGGSIHVQRQSLLRCRCDIAAGLHHDRAARPDRTGRSDRNSLLRLLPLRPPP